MRHLVAPAVERAPEHAGVIQAAWARLDADAGWLPLLDDPLTGVVTHADLHLDNVWWDGERVAGLLDLEWVRLGPPWLDLSCVRDNALAGDDTAEPHDRLLATLRREMPLLDLPDLKRRLTVVQLAFQLRQVLVWGPPGSDPPVDHPVRMLRRLLDLE